MEGQPQLGSVIAMMTIVCVILVGVVAASVFVYCKIREKQIEKKGKSILRLVVIVVLGLISGLLSFAVILSAGQALYLISIPHYFSKDYPKALAFVEVVGHMLNSSALWFMLAIVNLLLVGVMVLLLCLSIAKLLPKRKSAEPEAKAPIKVDGGVDESETVLSLSEFSIDGEEE